MKKRAKTKHIIKNTYKESGESAKKILTRSFLLYIKNEVNGGANAD